MDPQQLLSRLRESLAQFTTTQLVTMGASFALVVGIIAGSAYYLNAPNYVLLFSDMDPESMSQVITRLKSADVPYKLDEGGGGIRVPQDRVDELRLEMSAANLPQSGRIGFEIFERQRQLINQA